MLDFVCKNKRILIPIAIALSAVLMALCVMFTELAAAVAMCVFAASAVVTAIVKKKK